jgi:predicted RND superfamily exporter protein
MMDPGARGDAIGPMLSAELRSSLAACSILVTLVILLSIGRVLPGLIAMTPVLCGLGVVLGLLALLRWPIHPGNFLALPLLIGLGVDDGLYMVNRHLEGASQPLETTGVAVWRTSAATSIGFGSLVAAQTPAIASLGAIVLIGSVTCFITTVVLIPWLLRSPRNA